MAEARAREAEARAREAEARAQHVEEQARQADAKGQEVERVRMSRVLGGGHGQHRTFVMCELVWGSLGGGVKRVRCSS